MNKLQEILKWISEANNNQIDGLYEVIINQDLFHLDDFIDNEVIEQFTYYIRG